MTQCNSMHCSSEDLSSVPSTHTQCLTTSGSLEPQNPVPLNSASTYIHVGHVVVLKIDLSQLAFFKFNKEINRKQDIRGQRKMKEAEDRVKACTIPSTGWEKPLHYELTTTGSAQDCLYQQLIMDRNLVLWDLIFPS